MMKNDIMSPNMMSPIASLTVASLLILPHACFSFQVSTRQCKAFEPKRFFSSLQLDFNLEDISFMKGVSSRSDFVRSIGYATAVATSGGLICLPNQHAVAATSANVKPLQSVDDAVDVITKSCNRRFLYNVFSSNYNFLYRGLDPTEAKSPSIRTKEPCDLLNPDTCGSDAAASYFAALDKRMAKEKSPVLPSNGHLATTCPKAAAEWGVAASIWPIGGDEGGVHFAWFADGGLFWPRKEGASEDIIIDGRDCGIMSLDDALVCDAWEILFRASEGFVAVPVKFEAELRKGLQKSFAI